MWNGNSFSREPSTLADESKSWTGQRPLLSPASSVTSCVSIKSLPARVPSLTAEERKRINEEAYKVWMKNKQKQECEKKEKEREEQERKRKEKKEKEENAKKIEMENRARWLQKKQKQSELNKKKRIEAQKKMKQDQEEKRQFSKDMVSTWMAVTRNRTKPQKGNIYESPYISYTNPVPWQGVLEE